MDLLLQMLRGVGVVYGVDDGGCCVREAKSEGVFLESRGTGLDQMLGEGVGFTAVEM